MGFLCIGASSSSLLCAEDRDNILGCDDDEGKAQELGRNLDFSGFVGLQLESDKLVGSLMEKEREQLIETATGDYLVRLNNGGLELSWRIGAFGWICKVQAHYNFGPLCVYLAVNYLDRFLSSKQLTDDSDTPWMQQLLTVACLSLAAKMDETDVPQSLDIQVCDAKYVFEAKTIKRMEILVLSTLKWRMYSVTPFSYIDYFLDKFNEGKPLTNDLVSWCTELILSTLKETKFLQFRPSEIGAAVALSAVAEAQEVDFGRALVTSKIPVDKENVGRCHEAMQEMALVKKNAHTSASSSHVLDASYFTFRSDDNRTPGSSQTNNNNNDNNNQACTPASKRTRLDSAPMS